MVPQILAEHFADSGEPGIASVYLFGSHASDRAHADSDVDVAVLADRDAYPTRRDRWELRVRLGSELGAVTGNDDVDVVVLNDAPPELGRAVVTHGIRVFCGDSEADHAYVRDVQLRAADLVPWLRRMRRLKLAAIRG
ncbi:hypothetical protein BH23GEM4_BH23GEM4_04820 [soil metagenome]